ncbi:MAG TPA: STAS domain-containing protein [Kiritimatiellia bacterium]|nr:MAG: putative anti-sigma factor antagonist [Verrucomicrobia bacterium ADurb.Bin018]HOE00611.1 STAS domain-containing protein [Kiritimatiellia bacterium]HQM23907.1 STAS domain-containing protein [Kiritimatiellia bacterium]
MAEAMLKFEQEERDGVLIVHVNGPLDSMTHDQFREYLGPIMNRPKVRVVLDCQNLSYINSRGLTQLMHYQRISKIAFSFLGVAALRPNIVKNLELLGLAKTFRWYPTVEEALTAATAY